jgi:hypothetical protein
MKQHIVEVFKTDIGIMAEAERITSLLLQRFPGSRASIDLEDCDKVLRVEGLDICPEKIIHLVQQNGFYCNVLED